MSSGDDGYNQMPPPFDIDNLKIFNFNNYMIRNMKKKFMAALLVFIYIYENTKFF